MYIDRILVQQEPRLIETTLILAGGGLVINKYKNSTK